MGSAGEEEDDRGPDEAGEQPEPAEASGGALAEGDDAVERELLGDLLARFRAEGDFPRVMAFRGAHPARRAQIDALEARGLIEQFGPQYVLTSEGLRACGTDDARRLIELHNKLIPHLHDAYREDPKGFWSPSELAAHMGENSGEVRQVLRFLSARKRAPVRWVDDDEWHSASPRYVALGDVLSLEPIPLPADAASPAAEPLDPSPDIHDGLLTSIQIAGYRAFADLSALLGRLTVILGANATGKSSLFDLLNFLRFAAVDALPPSIDPFSEGKRLFHIGGPERLGVALEVAHGSPTQRLRYELEIRGPIGSPRVRREHLSQVGERAFTYLNFASGKGTVRDPADGGRPRPSWSVPPDELALRRALDPTLRTVSAFQRYVSSWSTYTGFDVSMNAPVRRPAFSEQDPQLHPSGDNLSAVLHSLMTEHQDAWEELAVHLRSAVPSLTSLNVKPRGKGMVMAVVREEGLDEELTLADLSDGTLRLLGWLALTLSPSLPPLLCIDEPEIGVHPRALPVLAGALKMASARSQILIATHSPYFLSHFALDDVAVMRKENGRAVFVRPGNSEALRREVEEIGGDALARMFISEELEVRA
jgi:predicted ATPase